jgi:5'-nucleotidase
VARLTGQLLEALETGARGGPLLPEGAALNVNFPDNLEGARWKLTRGGSYNSLKVRFVDDLGAASPIGPARPSLPHLPGVTVETNTASPRADQKDDEAIVYRRDIAVSAMQIGYDMPRSAPRDWLSRRLGSLTRK